MAGIKVYLSDESERRFRETAMKVFGYGKGSLSIAAEKALREWSTRTRKSRRFMAQVDNPVDAVWGILSKVKKSGVELQHEAKELRGR